MHELLGVHEAIYADSGVEVFDWKNGVYTVEFRGSAIMDHTAQLRALARGISHMRTITLSIESIEVIQLTPRGENEPGRNPGVIILARNV